MIKFASFELAKRSERTHGSSRLRNSLGQVGHQNLFLHACMAAAAA
jgi:hypothetical protein